MVLFIFYGFPAILGLAGTLGDRFSQKNITSTGSPLAPATPRLSYDFEATKSAAIVISGVTDGKTTIEIFQNGRSQGTTVSDDDGKFTLDVDLSRGENVFIAMAVSESGVKSAPSDEYRVSFLNTPPKLEINSPKDGENLKDSQVTVSGKTDPNVGITVNDHLAIVSGDGYFNYTLTFGNGENKIKVVALDRAGNRTEKELKVTIATP